MERSSYKAIKRILVVNLALTFLLSKRKMTEHVLGACHTIISVEYYMTSTQLPLGVKNSSIRDVVSFSVQWKAMVSVLALQEER